MSLSKNNVHIPNQNFEPIVTPNVVHYSSNLFLPRPRENHFTSVNQCSLMMLRISYPLNKNLRMTLLIGLILTLGNAVSKIDLRLIKISPFFKVRCPNSGNSFIEALMDAVSSMLLWMDDSMKTDFGTNDPLPTLAFLVGQMA
jgi:hypothetical protein